MATVLQKDIFYVGKCVDTHEWQFTKTEQLFFWKVGSLEITALDPAASFSIVPSKSGIITRTDAKRAIAKYLSDQISR